MLKILVLLATIAIVFSPAATAAPVKARVPSGIGILLIHHGSAAPSPTLTIFNEPSLGRIAEIAADRFPSLSHSIFSPPGTTPTIVTSKKSGWYRIVYDDGEREGWIQGRPSYRFYRWKELLCERPVSLMGGLRKEFYLLRKTPDSSSSSIATLTKGSSVTSREVEGDWIRVLTDSRTEGWIRWRDENNRLVIAISL